MYFIIYQTTNMVNGKIYIGAHQTNDLNDGYKGSGMALRRAFKKYGRDSFQTIILHECRSQQDMFEKEASIVTRDFVKQKTNYNLTVGGQRGPTVCGDYHCSSEHYDNVTAARAKAIESNQNKKQKRITLYNQNPKLCKHCCDPIPYDKRRNQFCSSSCSATYSNLNRENVWTEERRLKQSMNAFDRLGETKASLIRERRQKWRTQRDDETEERIKQLQQFLPVKRGWVTKASHVTGIQKPYMKTWIKNNIPDQFVEFYP